MKLRDGAGGVGWYFLEQAYGRKCVLSGAALKTGDIATRVDKLMFTTISSSEPFGIMNVIPVSMSKYHEWHTNYHRGIGHADVMQDVACASRINAGRSALAPPPPPSSVPQACENVPEGGASPPLREDVKELEVDMKRPMTSSMRRTREEHDGADGDEAAACSANKRRHVEQMMKMIEKQNEIMQQLINTL